jgi:hypothetical protein
VVPATEHVSNGADAKVDQRKHIAHGARLVSTLDHVAKAQLAVVVDAPTLDLPIVEPRAGVQRPDGHFRGRAAGAQVDGGQRGPQLGHLVARQGVAETKLSLDVGAPALERSGVGDGAAEVHSGGDGVS